MATQNSRGGGVHLKVRGGGAAAAWFWCESWMFQGRKGERFRRKQHCSKKVGELSRRNLELKIIKSFSNRISIPIIKNNSNN